VILPVGQTHLISRYETCSHFEFDGHGLLSHKLILVSHKAPVSYGGQIQL
jgi:hypothetical protein